MKIQYKKIKKIYILAAGVFFAFATSFSYLTNYLFYMNNPETYSNVGNVLSSLQFWIFLIAETVTLLYLGRKTSKTGILLPLSKSFCITAVLFMLSIIIFIITSVVKQESASIFETIMLCLSTFLFHLMFIINSKLFKAILAEERNKSK